MKLPFILLATLTITQPLSISVYAAENFADSPSQDLTRLNFYPHPGRLSLAPDVQYVPIDTSNSTTGTNPGNTTATQLTQFDLNVAYGLPLDGLRFGIAETWETHRWTDTTHATTGAISQTDSSGLSDPTFQLQYRFINAPAMGFSGDVNLIVSPSWTTHTVAVTTQEGNDGRGFGTTSLTGALYWIFPMNDVELNATLTRDFSGNGVNPVTPDSSYDRDSVLLLTMTAYDRFHLTQDFYLQGSLAFDLPYSYNQTNQAVTPVTTSFQYPFHINPSAVLGYRICENFVMDFTYGYQNYTTTSVPATPPNTTTLTKESTLTLRARFEI